MSQPLRIDLTAPIPPPLTGHLRMGGISPDGRQIGVNSRYLVFDGQPWLPVMGEFHYARTPAEDWETELLKMKAGGIRIVASYSFWIHHEEIQGEFDFTGCRDLSLFFRLCAKHGLWVWHRIGPWCHGECRNGGFPDWLINSGAKLRTDDPEYLEHARSYWVELQKQVGGLAFEDGGPIIGIQLENELMNDARHLSTLKRMAQSIGFKAPLWSVTGWGNVDIPDGQVLPVFGGYADGFWEWDIGSWHSRYRGNFFFRHTRNDTAIGSDLYRADAGKESFDVSLYPYATCETGGGMAASYHRRPLVTGEDTEALAYAMIGSGSNLQGYYMYHGGRNPTGRHSRLQESQDTGYPNDVPVVAYFPDAPLGDFGQVNDGYHRLRPLHLFLEEFGSRLAPMVCVLPEGCPSSVMDVDTLRWSVRHDGESGFLFVNNYQRREPLPDHRGVQFRLRFNSEEHCLPTRPVDIRSGIKFVWPVNLRLGSILIRHATAQPLCRADGSWIFTQTEGVPSEFLFDHAVSVRSVEGAFASEDVCCGTLVTGFDCSAKTVFEVSLPSGDTERFVVLSRADTLRAYKADASLDLADEKPKACRCVPFALIQSPDQADPVVIGPVHWGEKGVAVAPGDEAYEKGAIYRIELPADGSGLLEIEYVGSAARAWCGDTLVSDNFYSGRPWIVGLRNLDHPTLTIQIVPLGKDAPIYLEPFAWPDFPDGVSQVAEVHTVHLSSQEPPKSANLPPSLQRATADMSGGGQASVYTLLRASASAGRRGHDHPS